jgi:uncharacterized SAM-binding protein YcdF (DUF218 family)
VSPETAAAINTLVSFCARRDVPLLSRGALRTVAGDVADVAMLFGGSVVAGVDVLADAMRAGLATCYMIVGGEGHTTGAVRAALRPRMSWRPELDTASEAALYDRYLRERHGLAANLLEERSTNCGSNVTHSLALLRDRGLAHDRLLLIQDGTMQQRMDAGFRRHAGPRTTIVNYASHQTTVTAVGDRLRYDDPPDGMWEVEHYVSLLLGEVLRLTDDADGYGPSGRGYIAHVDVPPRVLDARRHLLRTSSFASRVADPRWGG